MPEQREVYVRIQLSQQIHDYTQDHLSGSHLESRIERRCFKLGSINPLSGIYRVFPTPCSEDVLPRRRIDFNYDWLSDIAVLSMIPCW